MLVSEGVMYIAHCHCKNVEVIVKHLPESLTQCNCSACYRYGAIWGYYTAAEVTLQIGGVIYETTDADDHPDLNSYCWGDKYITFHSCRKCGCMTHYSSTAKAQLETGTSPQTSKVAINYRMLSSPLPQHIKIRQFDGADTWQFIE